MLELFVNDQKLDTAGTSFNITLINPMFTNGLKGSYVFGISLPLTDKNKKVFNYPSRLEKPGNKISDYRFSAFYNGLPLPCTGKIVGTEVVNDIITTNVAVSIGEFVVSSKDNTLKAVDLGGDYEFQFIQDRENYKRYSVLYEYPEYKFVRFPIYNPDLYNGTPLESQWQDIKYINGRNYYNIPNPTFDYEVLFVYLGYVVKKIFETYGFSINKNPFEIDADLKKLVVINYYSDRIYDSPFTPARFNLKDYIPPHNINDFLAYLTKLFGSVYFIHPINQTVIIKFLDELIQSTDYIDYSKGILSGHESELYSFDPGYLANYNFDSKDSYINDRIKEIKEPFHTLIDPVQDYSDLPDYGGMSGSHKNEVAYVINENTYYRLHVTTSPLIYEWVFYSEKFFTFSQGSPELEIKSEISPLLNRKGTIDVPGFGGSWLTPACRIKLFKSPDEAWNEGDNIGWEKFNISAVDSFAPRLCFYRGIQESTVLYPMGTYDIYDYSGNVIGNKSLKLEGETGIFKLFWEKYSHWYNNIRRPVTFKRIMSVKELNEFDFSKKYLINGICYFIEEIKVPITDNSIAPATLKCLKAT